MSPERQNKKYVFVFEDGYAVCKKCLRKVAAKGGHHSSVQMKVCAPFITSAPDGNVLRIVVTDNNNNHINKKKNNNNNNK